MTFVGRTQELDHIESLLDSHRLVTIAGPPGSGKSRLAFEAAERLRSRFAEGVQTIFIPPVAEVSQLAPAIASLLRPGLPVDGTDADSLAQAIGDRELLLVVDDCDRLADAVAKILTTFLHKSTKLRVLATSRDALAAAGEAVLRLAPMTPTDALALFCERAGSSENAALVCRALAGNPLAIEVVASRKKPAGLGELIEHPATAPHAARNAIEWSYAHDGEEDRRIFRALASFTGGFTLDVAAEVCANDESGRAIARERLQHLIDAALVTPMARAGRYRLLQPVREFALERLHELDEFDAVSRRHAQAYDRLAQSAYDRQYDVPREAWAQSLAPELFNIRAALVWALDKRNDSPLGARIVGSLGALWREIGLPVEGLRRAQQAAVQIDGDGRLWLAIAMIKSALWMLPREQLEAAQRAETLFEAGGDRRGRIEALLRIGRAYAFTRNAEASKRAFEKAIRLAATYDSPRLRTMALYEAAIAAAQCEEFEEAKGYWSQVYPQLRSDGERRLASTALLNLAEVEFATGDPERAVECLNDVQGFGYDVTDQGTLKSNLTAYLVALDRREEAIAVGQEALRLMRLSEDRVRIVFLIQHLAAAFAMNGDAERGARLLGYTLIQYTAFDVALEFTERYTRDLLDQAVRSKLDAATVDTLMHEGSLFQIDRAAEEALRP